MATVNKLKKRIHYFDYASTTPVRPEVFEAMRPFFDENFGNPSNLDALGHRARIAVVDALEKISSVLNCQQSEFIFTGSATEADNLAIIGVARANKNIGNKIISSNLEHKGAIAACQALTKEGFEIIELKARQDGLIYPEDLEKLLDEKVILVSITSAENETGTIQPIEQISKVISAKKSGNPNFRMVFHTDASQAAPYLDLDVQKLGVDLMTLSAHKIYGPKGIGGLFIRKGTIIQPIIHGGGQQSRVRSGTENVPGIVGFAQALFLIQKEKDKEYIRVKKLRDQLEKGIFAKVDKVLLNGHPQKRLPNFLNVSILDIEGEAALLHLDSKGIIVNTGSACNSQTLEPSYILTALGRPYEFVHGSIRFTLGKYTNASQIKYVIKNLPGIVKELRKISPLNLNLDDEKLTSQPKAFIGGQTPHFLKKHAKKN